MRWHVVLAILPLLAPVAWADDLPVVDAPAAMPDPYDLIPMLHAGGGQGGGGVPYAQPARAIYLPIVQAEAAKQGVPPDLADAVAMVETGYSPNAVGTSGEIGLMQILPGTARMMGFTGTNEQLFDPATNIHLGVAYLARAWAASGGNACRALMKYRAGTGEESYSPLSIQYCRRASAWLATLKSPVGLNVAQHMPAAANAEDSHVIHLAGRMPMPPDLSGFAAIVDIPGVEIEGAPRRMAHLQGAAAHGAGLAEAHVIHIGGGGRAAAVMAEIQDGNTDPHVIHIPASDP
jgi:hypothetical protein